MHKPKGNGLLLALGANKSSTELYSIQIGKYFQPKPQLIRKHVKGTHNKAGIPAAYVITESVVQSDRG